VSKTERTEKITGKISADPNPVCFGHGPVVISWETNDPAGSEVRVSTSPNDEKLVNKSKERSGQTEIPWIVDSTIYDFRLYAASEPDTPIDSVEVRRDLDSASTVLRELQEEILRRNISMKEVSQFVAAVVPVSFRSPSSRKFLPVILRELMAMRETIDITELSQFIAAVMPRCLHGGQFHDIFKVWEQSGFHVTPVHFYQPIPDTRSLPETLWNRPSKLVGIDMNDALQLDLLRKEFPKFQDEYKQFPARPCGEATRFYLNNGLFDGIDALIAYCMVRHFQPRVIIEIGGGFSSLLLSEAAAKNNGSSFTCIEPFPQEFLKQGFPGLHRLIEKKVQDVDLEFFSQLQSSDMLFIDSSHTVKIGGDVNYLFLEVLPRLKPGVIVHVHDIFLPFDYRRDWVMEEFRFWTEQYLLQAFLSFNSEFEVLMANSYVAHRYMKDLKATFMNSPWWSGGSFWMRRKGQN
jgi:hypothetical protein